VLGYLAVKVKLLPPFKTTTMECYKLILEKNGVLLNYVFSAKDEAQKTEKLKAWKAENITPYDKVKLLFLGTIEEQEALIYKNIIAN
jgi:hypothetical protein